MLRDARKRLNGPARFAESPFGTKRTCQNASTMSALGGNPDGICSLRAFPLLTRSGRDRTGPAQLLRIWNRSAWLDPRSLDDWPPFLDVGLLKCVETLRSLLLAGR
jgi:hypothetical protein